MSETQNVAPRWRRTSEEESKHDPLERTRAALLRHAEEESVEQDLSSVVDVLCTGDLVRSLGCLPCAEALPSRDAVVRIVEGLQAVLFPGYFGDSELTVENLRFHLGHTLDGARRELQEQIRRGLCFRCCGGSVHTDCEPLSQAVAQAFVGRLPWLQAMLARDVQAAFEGDPAATSPDEAIFCYPGVLAITNFRIAHELHRLGVPLLPRMMTEQAHSITGIDIHPGADIGEAFFIDHGTGVVIGETCVIGKRVRLYQGVTLGAKSFPLDAEGRPIKGIPRHPIIEDDVIIYSGATILGRVTIGRGSVVGGNVWLTHSVPPGSRVAQVQPRADVYENGGGI